MLWMDFLFTLTITSDMSLLINTLKNVSTRSSMTYPLRKHSSEPNQSDFCKTIQLFNLLSKWKNGKWLFHMLLAVGIMVAAVMAQKLYEVE